MTSINRLAGPALLIIGGPVLLNVAFSSGCYGTSGSVDVGMEGGSDANRTPTATTGATSASTTATTTGTTTASTTGRTTGGDGGTTTGASDGGITTGTGTTTSTTIGTTTVAWGAPVSGGPTGNGLPATVTVDPNTTIGKVGADFVGFSYEKTHITNDSLNSTNTALVALYKLIGSPSMRLGGDDVENCNWGGTGAAPAAPSGQPFTNVIVSGMVDELCSFLAATGTKIIYAVNFRSDNVTASSAEAAYAEAKCGSSIYGFEIGNEINYQGTWAALETKWESFATAIVATPGALLIGPAAGGGGEESFVAPFAAAVSAKYGSKLVLLTDHYYAGAAGTSTATVARLQTPNAGGLVTVVGEMNTIATTNKIPDGYRMGETNTDSHHGQMGISDALIAGLWSLDDMFEVAESGGWGVNYHGGETGMDGTVPFYYEPIMEHDGVVVQAQPLYYGMLLFYLAGQGSVLSTTATTTNPYFTAYALKTSGWTSVVLDNKDTTGVSATVNMGTAVTSASAIYLQATPAGSLTAPAAGVTVAGAGVTPAGAWAPKAPYIQTVSGNTVSVYVPPASAVLVHVL